jgi:hypothetical protein
MTVLYETNNIVTFLKGSKMVGEKQPVELLDRLLFPKIFQTFRMAIQPTKLAIAFSALVIICLAGWLMDFSKTVVATQGTRGRETELQIYMVSPHGVQSYIESFKGEGEGTGVFVTLWHFSTTRFNGAVDSLFAFNLPGVVVNIIDWFKAIGWALKHHFFYCLIFFAITLAAVSFGGGAICRIAALQFARGEKPGLGEAAGFSVKKFTSFFGAPLVPVGMVIFIGVFIFLLGLIGNIPRAGELIMAIFMLLALSAGALIVVVAIGAVAGFNLMFPAVAYDGSDCFDAISRSFSYIYARPWRMVFYTAIAAVYGAICYTFVRFFAFLLLWVTHRFLQLGVWVNSGNKEVNKLIAVWPEPRFIKLVDPSSLAAANWSESLSAFLIQLLLLAVVGLVVSFIISFYFSANTVIYSLMRNRVDNTALDDIYTQRIDEGETGSTPPESGSEEAQPESE